MVTICALATALTLATQDRMARLSTSTVHDPHWPSPQP